MESFIPESIGDYIKCEVCGELFRFITQRHLSKHNLTKDEYQRLYPQAPLCSKGYSAKRSKQARNLYDQHPEVKLLLSEAQVKRFQNPEEKKKQSERMKEMFKNPKLRERHRNAVIQSWTYERRKKLSTTIENQWEGDEKRRRECAERMKQRWQLFRKQQAERVRKVTQSPGFRKKCKRGQMKLTETLKSLASKYSNEGYKAIPLHHGFPVPDLILIKDSKVTAVEVGYKRSNKYDSHPYYDEILWLKRRNKKFSEPYPPEGIALG